jgi:hypothetical protein
MERIFLAFSWNSQNRVLDFFSFAKARKLRRRYSHQYERDNKPASLGLLPKNQPQTNVHQPDPRARLQAVNA